MSIRTAFALSIGLAFSTFAAGAETPAAGADPAGVEFFEKKVRPVLAQHCYKCHAATSEKLKAGLYLDTRAGMLKGGDSGPAVVPGQPGKSRLIEAVRYTNEDMQMPPKTRLPEAVVADLTKWVQMGAPWPPEATRRPAAAAAADPNVLRNIAGVEYEKLRREHWAWQPVRAAAPPAVKNPAWAKSDIDRFLMAKMEAAGVKPVGDADRATLIRRVTFDLTGLPPTPEEVQAFADDRSPNAFEKVVDRLLASPRFGERWGRHWLDVARYAESTGSTRNVPYSHAWRYRDYVIDAFNKDKPYDQFVREQIAGDSLPAPDVARRNEQLVATGFLAIGVKDLNERDRLKYEMDNVDEQIDVTSRAILATTISCARCHDHKFDPIPTNDYYALAGIFKSTQILAGVQNRRGGGNYDHPELLLRLEWGTPAAAVAAPKAAAGNADSKVKELTAQLEQAREELRAFRAEVLRKAAGGNKPARQAATPAQRAKAQAKRQEVERLTAELAAAQSGKAEASAASATAEGAGDPAVGVRDEARPADARICIRGETDNLGPAVPRGFIGLFRMPSQPSMDPARSGRLELAQWLTRPENPLTARVMANRAWQHLFGDGLVRTVDNFGTTGEAPSHPELLDYLATRFVREGWSTKTLIRAMVLSRAYQLAGTYDAAAITADPSNRLVWRMSPRRLEAEAIRDAMLAAAGRLDVSRPDGSPVAGLPVVEIRALGAGARARGAGAASLAEAARYRSAYLPILRGLVPPVLDVFDFAEPTLVTGSRDVTTVATQALFLMNNPFVLEQSKALAERVLAAPGADDAGRVDLAYKLALARPPTAAERARAIQYVSQYAGDAGAQPKDAAKVKAEAWSSFCQALFASAEFRYLN